MFDTMTMTKAVGAICGALLVFLLGNWAATALYSMDSGHGAHGEEVKQAYVIETGADDAGAGDAADAGPDFATLYASADPAKGEKVFAKCKACHKLDGNDITGPHLNGVVDRGVASIGGFAYSSSLAALSGTTWTPEALETFLKSPKAVASNTKMSFAGLPKVDERANLIAYLATQH